MRRTTLYIILEGRVAVLIDIGGGRKTNVDTITKGETLGWSAMVPPHTMTAAAKAVERTRVVAIPAGGDARILLDELPDVLYRSWRTWRAPSRAGCEDTRLQLTSLMHG